MVTRSAQDKRAPVTVRVPFAASSVSAARNKLQEWMRRTGCPPEVVEDGRVVLSELVGNAVRHATPLSDGTILISWSLEDDGIRISVTDGGSSSRPRTLQAPASAVSGRGMTIVEALAKSWWSEHSRNRSTIHAVLGTS